MVTLWAAALGQIIKHVENFEQPRPAGGDGDGNENGEILGDGDGVQGGVGWLLPEQSLNIPLSPRSAAALLMREKQRGLRTDALSIKAVSRDW